MNKELKFILGVAVGAAIGATLGYAISSGKKDEWLSVLEEKASKVKDDLEAVIDKVTTSLQAVVDRA